MCPELPACTLRFSTARHSTLTFSSVNRYRTELKRTELCQLMIMIMIIILDRQQANADIHPKIAIKIAGLYS